MSSESLIRQLSGHVSATRFEDLKPAEVDRVRQCLFDHIGNMLAGRYSDKARGLLDYAGRLPRQAEAAIFGFGQVTAETAAFCNAAFSRVVDLDDGHRRAMGHPGVVIVPTVLALGEKLRASTPAAIDAIAAAYDVYVEIGSVINPSSYTGKGFDTTGIAGTVAVAAAAAKLRGLDAAQTRAAMAIAALHGAGIIEYLSDGSSGKLLCPGWTTATGLRSVDMALCGFTGPDTVLEGTHGLFRCFADHYDAARFGAELGRARHVMSTYFKVHACLRRLHPAIDAVLAARTQHALDPESVRCIAVDAGPFVVKSDRRRPRTLIAAQGSLPFALAVALKFGEVSLATLQAALEDEGMADLEDRISVVASDAVVARQAAEPSLWGAVDLRIETRAGATIETQVNVARGEPEDPLSWSELRRKFAAQLAPTPVADRAQALSDTAASFDTFATVDAFARALAGKPSAPAEAGPIAEAGCATDPR
ncbi:MAG: MmgE/PrpD family protein [Burkholderiales bacterium]|nr:MmgE/PrpD family protein [Burkholderiales bacterium]